jgi:hypothetical protein
MKKFKVTMVRVENRVFVYEVEAEDQEDAVEMAEELFEDADWSEGKTVYAEEFENGVEELKEVV